MPHDVRHHLEVTRQEEEQLTGIELSEVLREVGEILDVREHDGHAPAVHIEPRGSPVSMHDALHHRLGHEAGEEGDAFAEMAESVLQLSNLAHARAPAMAESGELLRSGGEIQGAQLLHQLAEVPQQAKLSRHQEDADSDDDG